MEICIEWIFHYLLQLVVNLCIIIYVIIVVSYIFFSLCTKFKLSNQCVDELRCGWKEIKRKIITKL